REQPERRLADAIRKQQGVAEADFVADLREAGADQLELKRRQFIVRRYGLRSGPPREFDQIAHPCTMRQFLSLTRLRVKLQYICQSVCRTRPRRYQHRYPAALASYVSWRGTS